MKTASLECMSSNALEIYQNNSANQRTTVTSADGSYWVYAYDALGQVTSGKKYWSDNTPVAGQQFEYTFDDIGNRTQTKVGGDNSGANLRTASYSPTLTNTYTSREVPQYVTAAGTANASATVTVFAQINTVRASAAALRKGTYFWGEVPWDNSALPSWVTVKSVGVIGSAGSETVGSAGGSVFLPHSPETFSYDGDGNLTSDGRWNYTWDAENRLVRMVANTSAGPQLRLDFEYDWKSRRIHKKVWDNTAGTGTPAVDLTFIYDGWNLIGELNASHAVVRSYLWGLDVSGTMQGAGGVGGLLAVNDSVAGLHFPAFDGNGNIVSLIHGYAALASSSYEYGPFGELLKSSGPMAKGNPVRFSTKYQDDETDYLYYGYRYYNPSTGRWVSKDRIEEKGGLNLYNFVGNVGVSRADVLGELTFEGCEGKEQELRQAFNDFCGKISAPGFRCCLGHFNIPDRLKWRCDHPDDSLHGITIKCEKEDSGLCKGFCGWSTIGGDTIHVCPLQWSNPNCGPAGCTLMHELTHTTGHPREKWPKKVEKCLGCGPRTT